MLIINSKQNVVLNTDKGGSAAVKLFVGWLWRLSELVRINISLKTYWYNLLNNF